MREVISRYSRRNFLQLLTKLAFPVAAIITVAAVILLIGPSIVVEWPARAVSYVSLAVIAVWIIIAAGPLLISVILGSIWEDELVWIEDGQLHVGLPFTRHVQLRDIRAVEAGYAPGEIFGRLLTISTIQGGELSFVTDVSADDWPYLKAQIEQAAQRAT